MLVAWQFLKNTQGDMCSSLYEYYSKKSIDTKMF